MSSFSSAVLRQKLRYGFRHLMRDNRLCERRIQTLLAREYLERGELQRIADRLLLKTLTAAVRNIPRYQAIKSDFTLENVREVLAEHFPVITRNDLIARPDQHYPRFGAALPWSIVGRTSGTSGTPLQILRSLPSVLWENAFVERQLRWCGYQPGMKRAYLRGDLVVPIDRGRPPYWLHNGFNNQLIISSRHLREEFVEDILAALVQFDPYLLQAYPSTAYELALLLERRGRHIRIPYVFTGSEPVYPHQRELIEQHLGARVLDHYGMAERVAYATECERGNLHLNTDYSYLEIVDEAGLPTDDEGYVVGTTFHNSVMPLVRYRLSDRTRWRQGNCPCGRSYPMIEPVTGKYEDTLYGTQGQRISPSVVTFAFKALHGIKRSQVAQVGAGSWEIRVVPGEGFDDAERHRLIENVRQLVDPGLAVTVREVDDIARTAADKYRWIVNEYRPSAED